ncbi:PucR family transcriptional regulator [Anaerosacchariphilus polymeriproducens]|uniref:PucR family transcriptional regulator n=1 Tax=Anaerosacchariphilus polymeriproducens TaxID=1812858 RepID=A0A371AWY4_9FIRM|nr:PucR family transcriptional regulator [Anaerosacchariphilus polymeriproducens]RDU24087.1 PucR family transcriptional regulator [Anaerosacchariphilus polymeriproducens]
MNNQDVMIRFMNLISQDVGLKRMLDELSALLQLTIGIVDESFRLIEFSESGSEISNGDQYFSELSGGMLLFSNHEQYEIKEAFMYEYEDIYIFKPELLQKFKKFGLFKLADGEDIIGYCFISINEHWNHQIQSLLLEKYLITILKMELIKVLFNRRKTRGISSDFVTYVLMGNITDSKELAALCDMNGFDYSVKRICIIIKPARKANMSRNDLHKQEVALAQGINKVCKEKSLNSYRFSHNNNIILYLFFNHDKENQILNRYGLEVTEAIFHATGSEYKIQCGIGKCYEGISTVGKSFKQAIDAINLGERIHKDKKIYSYYDDFLYHILNDGMSFGELTELYDDTIGKLNEFDEKSNSELVVTLKQFINCSFKSKETAEKLHLHRNTLAYRLDKIREILAYDLEDGNNNMRIQMGLYAKDLIEIHELF